MVADYPVDRDQAGVTRYLLARAAQDTFSTFRAPVGLVRPSSTTGTTEAPRKVTRLFPDLRFRLLVTDCCVIPMHKCEQEQHPSTDQYRGHCRGINARQ